MVGGEDNGWLRRNKQMTRWTETSADVKHISEMNRAAPSFGIVWVRLKDGTEFYG
jgi:hypothetical protein